MQLRSLFLLVMMLLTGCAKINSLAPFDAQQARLLLNADAQTTRTRQGIVFSLPATGWEKVTAQGQNTTQLRFVRRSGFAAIKTTLFSASQFPLLSMQDVISARFAAARTACRGATLEKLVQQVRFIVYRINYEACAATADHVEIGKVFRGEEAIYLIYYSALLGETTLTERDRMQRVIARSELVQDTPHHFSSK
jgi:hypothetical protein